VAIDARPDGHQRVPTAGQPAEGERRRLGPARRAQSRLQAGQPAADLVLGDVELGSDLGVRPALREELEQAALDVVQAR
jgi:hypothetical protein